MDCKYVLDDFESNAWECSNCKLLWQLTVGTPKENNMNYCPQCGAKIIEEIEYVYCTNCYYFRLDDEYKQYCMYEDKCNINNPEDSQLIEERPFYKEK